jgi:hypothetical protein
VVTKIAHSIHQGCPRPDDDTKRHQAKAPKDEAGGEQPYVFSSQGSPSRGPAASKHERRGPPPAAFFGGAPTEDRKIVLASSAPLLPKLCFLMGDGEVPSRVGQLCLSSSPSW